MSQVRQKFSKKGFQLYLKILLSSFIRKFLNKIYLDATIYLVRILPYKNADKRLFFHGKAKRKKNEQKLTKNGYCVH